MKPVCVPCQRFFRMRKAGFYFIEGMPVGPGRPQPGTAEPKRWIPYKVWAGDRWECLGCGAAILCGFGNSPVAERHNHDFGVAVAQLHADQLQVNDC